MGGQTDYRSSDIGIAETDTDPVNNFPVQHGLLLNEPDHRNYSFSRTFGAASPITFPDEYNCDTGLYVPDQNADGYPEACTGYTQSDICMDEDRAIYKPSFTYLKTLLMEGAPFGSPCSQVDSLKSTLVYGVQMLTEVSDEQAATHRRGAYFQIQTSNGLDFFNSVRSALWLNRLESRSVSCGTPWFHEWSVAPNGVVHDFTYDGVPPHYSWHNWKICGWREIDGQTYLIGKSWQGVGYGDKGFHYISRDIFNRAMTIDGTAAFMLGKFNAQNIQVVELTILQQIVSYYRLLLKNLGL